MLPHPNRCICRCGESGALFHSLEAVRDTSALQKHHVHVYKLLVRTQMLRCPGSRKIRLARLQKILEGPVIQNGGTTGARTATPVRSSVVPATETRKIAAWYASCCNTCGTQAMERVSPARRAYKSLRHLDFTCLCEHILTNNTRNYAYVLHRSMNIYQSMHLSLFHACAALYAVPCTQCGQVVATMVALVACISCASCHTKVHLKA